MRQESDLKRRVYDALHGVFGVKGDWLFFGHLIDASVVAYRTWVLVFLRHRFYLSKFATGPAVSGPLIWRSGAFYGFVPFFATVQAKVVVHAMLPLCWSELSLSSRGSASLGGINFGFFSDDFADPGVTVTPRSRGAAARSQRGGKGAPIVVQFPGFAY